MDVGTWFHAVNGPDAVAEALAHFSKSGEDEVTGIECDVRCCSRTSRPVLSHDPLHHHHHADPSGASPKMPLAELAEAVRSVATTFSNRRCVVKLDFKDQLAATLVVQGKVSEVSRLIGCSNVEVWGNADLVRCEATDEAQFKHDFPQPALWTQLASLTFPVLSIGFHRPGAAMSPYDEGDVDSLDKFLAGAFPHRKIDGDDGHPTVLALTLPLRLSLFREDEGAQAAVRAMLTSLSDALRRCYGGKLQKEHRTFLTVWRGREEVISDEDVTWLKGNFAGCSIDRA